MHWLGDIREKIHYALHVVFIPVAMWAWNERRVLKDVLEEKLERRHTMIDPKKLQEKMKVVTDLIVNAPKLIADVTAATANAQNPTAEAAAIAQLLTDLQPAIADLTAEIATATTPQVPPAPAA